jgi:hypothetical protein
MVHDILVSLGSNVVPCEIFEEVNVNQVDSSGSGKTACSFCGRKEDSVGQLISGPGVNICVECVEICVRAMSDPTVNTVKDPNWCCSFCGTKNEQVKKMIQGPGLLICNECVDLTDEIRVERQASK